MSNSVKTIMNYLLEDMAVKRKLSQASGFPYFDITCPTNSRNKKYRAYSQKVKRMKTQLAVHSNKFEAFIGTMLTWWQSMSIFTLLQHDFLFSFFNYKGLIYLKLSQSMEKSNFIL